MNTAARLEHTGQMNRIHVSEATAELLKAAGKEHWLRLREDVVEAKGLGKMRTYWANVSSTGSSRGSVDKYDVSTLPASSNISIRNELGNVTGENSRLREDVNTLMNEKTSRLIDWNVEILIEILKRVHVRRLASGIKEQAMPAQRFDILNNGKTVLHEVAEIIALPEFDAAVAKRESAYNADVLDPDIKDQLKDYVTSLALM
jgi:Adenylate and Guanylate cyclase catalytic domain